MSAQRTSGDMLRETTSLLCAVAFYGPPVVFFAAPWLLLSLMLIGPFTLILTLLAAILAAGAVVGAIAILSASAIALLRTMTSEPSRLPIARGWGVRSPAPRAVPYASRSIASR